MFCPSCGKEKQKSVGKICLDCFIKDKQLTKISDYLDVDYCVSCGSFKENGGWREPIDNPKVEAAESAIMSSLGIHKEIKNPKVVLDSEVSGDQVDVNIEVIGEIEEETITLYDSTMVRLDKKTCDKCSRISGGYFEAIVQIRGTDREISEEEKTEVEDIINDLLSEFRDRGEKAFIGDVEYVDDGVNIYAGSSRLAKRVSKMVVNRFGGSYSQSASLIGMRDGQEVHRVTYAVRLPPFEVGDVTKIGEKLVGITGMGNIITGINLENGKQYKRNWKYIKDMEIEKIGEKNNIKKGTISLVSSKEVQVVEPWNYENISLEKPDFIQKQDEGTDVSMLRTNKKILLLPQKFLKDLK